VIALDTNVLVRLLVHDDESQSRAAERVVVRARHAGTRLYVSDVVLCELAWVLRARYRLPREEIAKALDAVLRTELIVVDDVAMLDRALAAFRRGPADFADYLIGETARRAGATEVVTLDRVMKGDGVRLVG
jgi:predicted nucleic-acid-binding protein